ncbi:MAG: DUF432 domain-containing protein [Methanomicrobiales archaeon]|nr:DUF432 domain-containing protein [Methanomicrobiales archaeon]
MYGTYTGPISIESERFTLNVTKEEQFLRYTRTSSNQRVEKIIPSGAGEISIHPVEPVNLPSHITKFVEIRFGPVILTPNSTQEIFLHFPVEFGVFVGKGSVTENLDIFSFCAPKYSLYGSPGNGVICRWVKSSVFSRFPAADRLKQGVMLLRMKNMCQSYVEVSRAVFEADGMRLFFGDLAGMSAEMTVMSSEVAETVFLDKPPAVDMKPAIELFRANIIPGMELYAASKLPRVERNGFLMEWGLV